MQNEPHKPSDTKRFFDELSGLAADIEDLRKKNEHLQHEVNYWRIEAQTDHDRWLRAMEENDKLRKKLF